jgi:DNA replication protein DnaC
MPIAKTKTAMHDDDPRTDLRKRASKLGLHGLVANWEKVASEPWLPELIRYEESERARRSLERRVRNAKLQRFKPMADFDWQWPQKIDRELIEELFEFDFVPEAANVVLIGSNGLGKTMIAKNLAHQAVLKGWTVRFLTASELLNDLAAQESSAALSRRLKHYAQPHILAIDEVGYLATSSEHADLLFEVVTRRYQEKSIILTTNKTFREWKSVFPNSSSVIALIDRLIHKAEIVKIEGKSYRLKESEERNEQRKKRRSKKKKGGK